MRRIKQALILAGGDSSRFWPLANKQLFSFLGKTLIEHQIEAIKPYVGRIYVVVSEAVGRHLKNIDESINVLKQTQFKKGMAGAILSAQKKIDGEVIIINASDLIDQSLYLKYITSLRSLSYAMIFSAQKIDQYLPLGYWRIINNKVTGLVEKPSKGNLPSNYAKLVVDYFADFNQLTDQINQLKVNRDDGYEIALNQLFQINKKIKIIKYHKEWVTIKYPWQALLAMRHFFKEIKKTKFLASTRISPTATIIGSVHLGKNIQIGDFAKVVGPCFIDDGTVIGDYSLVRECHVGKNCVIGGGCEVARSYLADRVMLHRNYVGDSVLADNVLMGAGTITANYRFDGAEITSIGNREKIATSLNKLGVMMGSAVKIGVNAAIMPGVKIGAKAIIGPGEIVADDVADSAVYFSRFRAIQAQPKAGG